MWKYCADFHFQKLSIHTVLMSVCMSVCPQAAGSDILRPGQEPGKAVGVLLHAGGLHWPGEDGASFAREPQTPPSKYISMQL